MRVLAATHRDLEAMCAAGTFREDLLYRLNAMTLHVPPLRERSAELDDLIERFVAAANVANDRRVVGLDEEADELLRRYSWPGNIRELKNAIERAVVIAPSDRIGVDDLPQRVRELASRQTPDVDDDAAGDAEAAAQPLNLKAELSRYEGELILRGLRAASWDRHEAARLLGLPLRTLHHKMRSHGIKRLAYEREDEG